MPFSFDSTVGGASANSFVSVSDADDYFGGRLDDSEWTVSATGTALTNQQAALSMATYRLDAEEWVGQATYSTQRLKWPRALVPSALGYGYEDSTAIPRRIEEATFELALAILKDTTFLSDTGLEGFQHVKVGPLDVTPLQGRKANSLPAHVARMLRGLRMSADGQSPVMRG